MDETEKLRQALHNLGSAIVEAWHIPEFTDWLARWLNRG